MSSGGSWKSATVGMTASPSALRNAWYGDRVGPKLRVLTMTWTRLSSAAISRRTSPVPSVDALSMNRCRYS